MGEGRLMRAQLNVVRTLVLLALLGGGGCIPDLLLDGGDVDMQSSQPPRVSTPIDPNTPAQLVGIGLHPSNPAVHRGVTSRMIVNDRVAVPRGSAYGPQGLVLVDIAAAPTHRQLLDFEDLPVGAAVFNQYPGITFPGGDGNPPVDTIIQPPLGTLSGVHALQSWAPTQEFGLSGIAMVFTEGQHRVSLSTGLITSSGIRNGAILTGFSDDGTMVASSPLVLLGSFPTTIQVPLEINSSQGLIRSASLKFVDFDDPTSSQNPGMKVAVDNVDYDAPIMPPPPDTTAPLIEITHPMEAEQVQGGSPGEIYTFIEGAVTEQALKSLTMSVNGGADLPIGHGGVVNGQYRLLSNIGGASGLRDGMNQVVVTATDFADNTSTLTRHFIYAVKPVPPPSTVDITPIAVEVTQAIDVGPRNVFLPTDNGDGFRISFPAGNDVPLVRGNQTLVRIYAVAKGSNANVDHVPARLTVLKDNCTDSCWLGSDLRPVVNARTPLVGGLTVLAACSPGAACSASAEEQRPHLDRSWNFLIPADWTAQDLKLLADVNVGVTETGVQECTERVVGRCQLNNRVEIHLSFLEQKTVTVRPVLVHFQGEFGGTTVDDITPMSAIAKMFEGMTSLYPTNFVMGPVDTMVADPAISDSDLLDAVQSRYSCPSDIWACAGSPSQFEVALVPGRYNLESGGLANVGNDAVWARVDRITPSHEMGHAIGFEHASCDHGEGSGGGCDGAFPIPHGGTGGFGFDFTNWKLVVPTAPNDHNHDLMSYGADRWVSTVTWRITADHPFVDSVSYKTCWGADFPPWHDCGLEYDAPAARRPPMTTPSYLVSGRIDTQHMAHLSDAYELPSLWSSRPVQPGTPNGYRLEAVDAQGNTLLAKDFRASLYGPMPGDFMASFHVMIDKPVRRIKSIKILDDVTTIGVLTARTPEPPSIQITSIGGPGTWRRGEVHHVTWQAASGEDTMLTARVEYAPGEPGKSGRVLAANVSGGALDVPVQTLPASKSARIVVRASNGIDTAVAMSDPFEVEETGPTVVIIDPPADVTVAQGVPVSFSGLGADDQTPIADASLAWQSSLSGALGTGSHLTVDALPVGTHLVTFTAHGQNGLVGTATVHITVLGEGNGCCDSAPSNPPVVLVLGVALLLCRRRHLVLTERAARGSTKRVAVRLERTHRAAALRS